MTDPIRVEPVAREQGTALILSLFFTIIALGIVVSGSIILRSNQQRTDTSFRVNAQALQFARAGVTDSLSWFRRQPTQPVLAFEPVRDANAVPPVLDTDDPDVGIVREFRISGAVWGRYEVWKDWPADPDPERLAFRDQYRAEDVSGARGNQSPGNAWRIRSIGTVYRRVDENVPLDQAPNVRLGIRMLETEIRRLRLSPPGQAAVCVRTGGTCQILAGGRIRGGSTGAGIYYPQGTGNPTLGSTTGSPPSTAVTDYDDDPEVVFGVTFNELTAMADDVVTDAAQFPSPVPQSALIVSTAGGTLTFDGARPLRGTAIVYIQGDVVIAPNSNSVFNGLLYVDGDLTIRQPSEVNGAIVCTGAVTVQGDADFATVNFDEDVLSSLRVEIGNYRLSGAVRSMFSNEDR